MTKAMKRLITFQGAGKKALALLLSAALVITTLPVIQMPAGAEGAAGVQDSGYVADKDGFHVVAYDKSARIEIPYVSGAKNYKVVFSQSAALKDYYSADCVLNSDTYQPYTYVLDGDTDALDSSKTVSIGYTDGGNNKYYFYLVTSDGYTDTVQDSVEVETRSTADATWTSPGHYDTGWYGDGSASEFTIKTAAQLAGLAVLTDGLNDETATSFTGKTIHLASSVDLSDYLWTPIGTSGDCFYGSFDGGNYDGGKYTVQNVVTGLHTNKAVELQGLFGYTLNVSSSIKNIGVVSSYIYGSNYIGGIAGQSYSTIDNCYFTGSVHSSFYAGGIAGASASNPITNCYNTGSITSTKYAGGIAGQSTDKVTNCYNTGSITGTGWFTGGVLGRGTDTITGCYNTGTVTGADIFTGGIVGRFEDNDTATGYIFNCYNTGTVTGVSESVGGIAGDFKASLLANCYNIGDISGKYSSTDTDTDANAGVGGIAGTVSDMRSNLTKQCVTNCYNKGSVTGDTGMTKIGGICGANDSGLGGLHSSAKVTIKDCYNAGKVSGQSPIDGIVGNIGTGTLRSSYNTGEISNESNSYFYIDQDGTRSNVYSLDLKELPSNMNGDGAFMKAPTASGSYGISVFTSSNPVNQGYPVLRSFGYTDDAAANGFSPATMTIDVANGTVTAGTDYGDGTESKPYIIRNAYQMDLVRNDTKKEDVCFKLAGNIDISPAQYNKTPDENGSWIAIGGPGNEFQGSFDGNHFAVSGMSMFDLPYQSFGLFSVIKSGTIQNLGAACSFTMSKTGNASCGSIVGKGSGTIQNCYNAGTINCDGANNTACIGGVIGTAGYSDYNTGSVYPAAVANCYNAGTVIQNSKLDYGDIATGGVVGACKDVAGSVAPHTSTLSWCCNAGTVSGASEVGGVAGTWSGNFTNSYNAGKVSATDRAGGVAYQVTAASETNKTISNCYNIAVVNGMKSVGGVFEYCAGTSSSENIVASVSNCFNTGTVSNPGDGETFVDSHPTGGVIGSTSYAAIQNCYNTGKVTGVFNLGGLAGKIDKTSLQSSYNTGAVSSTPRPENYTQLSESEGRIGGMVGTVASGSLKNCYNTGKIKSGYSKVGGIAGAAESATVTNCYNAGDVKGHKDPATDNNCTADVGGISGYLGGDSTLLCCYNLGIISGDSSGIGALVGYRDNRSTGGKISKCYFSGCNRGINFIGAYGDNTATPFVSFKLPLYKGNTEDVKEVAYADLDPEFKAAFGITDVQYPDGYESSNTDVVTVKDKTVTAVDAGMATISGMAKDHSNAKIVISQNALNMTNPTSGFNNAGTEKVSGVVNISAGVLVPTKFTAFSVKAGDGKNYSGKIDDSKNTILVKVPDGTDVSSLVATFTVNNGEVSVNYQPQTSGVTQNDFSSALTYTINGSDRTSYTVKVVPESQSLNRIDEYDIKVDGKYYDGKIDETNHMISVKVPSGTDRSSLIANFSANDAELTVDGAEQENGVTPNDFTSPVSYKVTGLDGSTATYTVTVTCADNSEKSLTSFDLDDSDDNEFHGTIDQTNHTISVKVPKGTDVTNLTAWFDTFAPSVKVGDKEQKSGTTANDFTNPVTYTVTAADGSTQDYTVKVVMAGFAAMESYSLKAKGSSTYYDGVIDKDNHTIAVTVPKGTDVTKLVAKFTASDDTTVSVVTTKQVSETTVNSFANPVTYTVKASDGTKQNYTVTVKVASGAEFQSYSLKEKDGSDYYTGTIDNENHKIAVTVPKDTDVTKLVAKFAAADGAAVTVGTTAQESGKTENDFTNPVTYTVTAANNFTQDYTVKVIVSGTAAMESYSLKAKGGSTYYDGVIDEDNHTIAVTVPKGTDVTKLIAKFTASDGTTVSVGTTKQVSETTVNNFANPVTYTVKAADSTKQDYKVTVKVASGAEFQSYSLKEKDGSDYYTGTIDNDNHTIQVKVPYGTDVTQLIAKFATVDDAPVTIGTDVQESGTTENDFTKSVIYTVKTAEGAKQKYKVTVTVVGETSFQSYSLTDENGNAYDGMINEAKGTIAVTVAKNTNVKKLTADFTTSAAVTVKVKDKEQVSGETINDFTSPVTYTVTAPSGSTKNYKVTVTVPSSPAPAPKPTHDDDRKHHHHDRTEVQPAKPAGNIQIDSANNSAAVLPTATGVQKNGTTTDIQVVVPTIPGDTTNSGNGLDLSKKATVTVALPTDAIVQQLSAKQAVDVTLTLPAGAGSGTNTNVSYSIKAAKEILEAAKESAQDLALKVQYTNQQQTSYTWTFKGDDLAKSGKPLSDVDMQMSILPAAKVSAVNRLTNGVQGLVVEFAQDGALPAPAAVGFSAQDQGLAANQSMDLYQYDSVSGQLIPTGKKVTVDAFGNTDLSVDSCHEYVLLPDSVRTITLDTRVYTMNVGSSYETGVTLLNAPAGSRLKTYSSTDGVIATTVLPNGNVKAVGLKPGLTYAMIDVYDSKNRFLTHASVRIIIKETDHPSGNSFRQFGIY